MNALVEAQHLVELENLKQIFMALGYEPVELHEKSAQIPFHTLLVGLEMLEDHHPPQLALTFYPVAEFEETLFLQYFSELPFSIKDSALPVVQALLPEINNKLVIGYFGISEAARRVHLRYVQALNVDDDVTLEHIENVAAMFAFSPILFADLLAATASGQLTLEAARAKLNEKYPTTA